MRGRLDPWLQRLWADRPDPPAGGGLYLLRGLLIPFAMLYASFAWTRRELYRNGFLRSRHLHGTVVVSIGNLTVGGTGKSPLAIGLARGLMDADLRVAVISRGYGGSGRGSGPLLVSDGSGPLVGPDLAGDEPVMIARATSAVVIVSRHRYLGARLARDHYGAQLIILDDGFQHLGLARQADLVLLDVNEPFGNRWALPAGPLREPLSALADADLCLFVQRDNDQAAPLPERLHRLMQVVRSEAEVLSGRLRVQHLRRSHDQHRCAPDGLKGKKVLLVSGVAHPKPFEQEMRRLGIGVIEHRVYPDHYRYRSEEVARIIDGAREVGAEGVVTTAKDEVKWIAAGGHTVDPPLWVAEIGYDPRIVNLLVEALAGLCNGPSAREPSA